MAKGRIVQVTRVSPEGTGGGVQVVVYRKKGRKKGTRGLEPTEKLTRRAADAQATFAEEYLSLHRRSSAKKKDGWLRDIDKNVILAVHRARKKLPRFFLLP